jgi:hypothetical protein
MRAETDKILVAAAAAGADLRDLATIAGLAVEKWRQQQPDADRDRFDHADRYLSVGTTFGGAGVVRGDLTPECAAALTAVLEALGKRRGPADDRSQKQRFHDALQEALEMLLAARLVPERAGAATQAVVHIPIDQLRDMPGAPGLEDEWLRARLGEGEPGYLDGKDAETAACDAQAVPVVTGRADLAVIDKLIALAHATCCGGHCQARPGPGGLSAQAWQAHRYAIARLAIDFVSGPGGIAAALRTGLLEPPYSAPACRWTSASPKPSPARCAAPSSSATSTAPSPAAATPPPPPATCTTSSTNKTAAPPAWPTSPCTASSTTRSSSTAGAGKSPSTPTAAPKPAAPTVP